MIPKEIVNGQWLASSALIISFVILASICVCILCIFNSDCITVLNRFLRRVWHGENSRIHKFDPEDPNKHNKEDEEDNEDETEEEEDFTSRKISITSPAGKSLHLQNKALQKQYANGIPVDKLPSSSRSTSSAHSSNDMFSSKLKKKALFDDFIAKDISLTSLEVVQPKDMSRIYTLTNHYPQKNSFQQSSSSFVPTRGGDNNVVEDLCDPGCDHGLGKLQFTLSYDIKLRKLNVKIVQAVDLPAMDLNGFSDPYVKITILPDKLSKVQTSVRDRKLNPKWNELFTFEEFPSHHLVDHMVHMMVLDYDRFSRDDPIGEIHFPLILLNQEANANKELSLWKFLRPTKKSRGVKMGEILLELCYNPQTTTLSIKVNQAHNFKPERQLNLYCQIKFTNFKDKKTLQKVKTSTQRRTPNPIWNEMFTLQVGPSKLKDISIEVAVKHKEMLGTEVMGRLRLGSRSSAAQTQHWSEMLSKPREFVAEWHTLKQ